MEVNGIIYLSFTLILHYDIRGESRRCKWSRLSNIVGEGSGVSECPSKGGNQGDEFEQ